MLVPTPNTRARRTLLAMMKAPLRTSDSTTTSTRRRRPRNGLVINDLPSAESKTPSQFGGVLLASVPMHRSPRTRATTHTMHSGVHRSLALSSELALLAWPVLALAFSFLRCTLACGSYMALTWLCVVCAVSACVHASSRHAHVAAALSSLCTPSSICRGGSFERERAGSSSSSHVICGPHNGLHRARSSGAYTKRGCEVFIIHVPRTLRRSVWSRLPVGNAQRARRRLAGLARRAGGGRADCT